LRAGIRFEIVVTCEDDPAALECVNVVDSSFVTFAAELGFRGGMGLLLVGGGRNEAGIPPLI